MWDLKLYHFLLSKSGKWKRVGMTCAGTQGYFPSCLAQGFGPRRRGPLPVPWFLRVSPCQFFGEEGARALHFTLWWAFAKEDLESLVQTTNLQVHFREFLQSLKPVTSPQETVQDTRGKATQVFRQVAHVGSQVAQRQQTEPGSKQVFVYPQQVLLLLHKPEQLFPVGRRGGAEEGAVSPVTDRDEESRSEGMEKARIFKLI